MNSKSNNNMSRKQEQARDAEVGSLASEDEAEELGLARRGRQAGRTKKRLSHSKDPQLSAAVQKQVYQEMKERITEEGLHVLLLQKSGHDQSRSGGRPRKMQLKVLNPLYFQEMVDQEFILKNLGPSSKASTLNWDLQEALFGAYLDREQLEDPFYVLEVPVLGWNQMVTCVRDDQYVLFQLLLK